MPPYVAASGPLGKQGRHNWNGVFALNDLESMPRAHVDRISGLFALPEIEDKRDPKIGANGEVIYPSFTRGKTITYEGRLITADESIYAYRWQMLDAFEDQTNEGTMTITPHPGWGSGGWTYQARVLGLEIDDEIVADSMQENPSPYQLPFILSLRMRNNVFTQV